MDKAGTWHVSDVAPTHRRRCMVMRVWRRLKYSALHSPTDYLSLRMWMTSSARVRGLCMPSAYCGPTVLRCQLCSRCSVWSSSLSSLTPLRRGGALRRPPTDSVSILFWVELFGLTCGHRLGSLTRTRSRTSATQLMMNCSPKSELPPTTFCMPFCHRHLPHHRTTVLDSVYTHFSYVNAQHISLTVISWCACCIRTAT